MTGVVGALVVLAVLAAVGLAMAVRPRVRRLAQAVAAWRREVDAALTRLRALRRARPRRPAS